MKVFLDDIRNPQDAGKYMHSRIGKLNPIYFEGDWYIVRNYEQFTEVIRKYSRDITHVSFDHDLADVHYHESMDNKEAYEEYLKDIKEKTGYECAVFLKEYYKVHLNNKDLPIMFVHSMNPVGTERIINLFK